MNFVHGLLAIEAPASALNNAGMVSGERTDNVVAVKKIPVRGSGAYPYVSAQAFRYWVRTTLAQYREELGWVPTRVFREAKVAYSDGNPILYWEDDLFGYMRAQSKREEARRQREADSTREGETPTEVEITRTSPFRVSTLVALHPVVVNDFGVMSRHDDNPVPHEHEFYHTILKGLFSLDLASVGTFTYRSKTGLRNLDSVRIELARQRRLEHLEAQQAYRLPRSERVTRAATLLRGLARLEGGAKQTLHLTSVLPSLVVAGVFKGGNNPFWPILVPDRADGAKVHLEALREVLSVWGDMLLSPVYVGWATGFIEGDRGPAEQVLQQAGVSYHVDHPRRVFEKMAEDLESHPDWMD